MVNVMAWLVQQAMPGEPDSPQTELFATEVAENAIRQTACLTLGIGVLVLGLAGGIAYSYGYLSSREVTPPPGAAEALQQLRADNAKLTAQTQELQHQIDDLTKERGALQARVVGAEKQMPPFMPQPLSDARRPAEPPAGETKAAAVKAPARVRVPTAGKPTVRPPKRAAVRAPATASTAREGLAPLTTVECGDGRRVRDAASCTPTGTAAPTEQLDVDRTYHCGDGRTARDPAACRPLADAAG